MPSLLPPELAGVLALLALLLLPGVLIVRAPWTVVPALSVAFWTLSWWWIPVASRTRALGFALAAAAVLGVLRLLPKHVIPPPPDYTGPPPPPPVTGPLTGAPPRLRSGPSLVVVAVALALLAPFVLMPHAPGREMAFHTTAARAAVWRDALPATYEPLLPLGPFGAHAPALATLAADASLLSGLQPGQAVALAALASAALLLLGVFALYALGLPSGAAAFAALLGLAAVRWPGFFATWGEGGPLLALALSLPAAVLLLGHTSRPSAVAAGVLLGAGLLAQPVLAVGVAAAAAVAARARAAAPEEEGVVPDDLERTPPPGGKMGRLGLSFTVATVLAAPGLWRLGRALSAREAWAAFSSLEAGAVADLLMGLVLLVFFVLLAALVVDPGRRKLYWAARPVILGAGATLLILRVTLGLGAGQLDPESLRELAALERENRPLEAVCAPEPVIDWVPGLAGRPAGTATPDGAGPWVPHVLREEKGRQPRRGCSRILDGPGVTTFDVRPRNPR